MNIYQWGYLVLAVCVLIPVGAVLPTALYFGLSRRETVGDMVGVGVGVALHALILALLIGPLIALGGC